LVLATLLQCHVLGVLGMFWRSSPSGCWEPATSLIPYFFHCCCFTAERSKILKKIIISRTKLFLFIQKHKEILAKGTGAAVDVCSSEGTITVIYGKYVSYKTEFSSFLAQQTRYHKCGSRKKKKQVIFHSYLTLESLLL